MAFLSFVLDFDVQFANTTRMVEGRIQLRAWIDRAKLQDQEAAQLIGISRPFMSHILNGHRRPTLPIAVKIEETTGIVVASWVPMTRGGKFRRTQPEPEQPSIA